MGVPKCRAGSSSGRVIAYDQREDIVRPRVRREDESGQQEEVKLGEKPHKFWGRIQSCIRGPKFYAAIDAMTRSLRVSMKPENQV